MSRALAPADRIANDAYMTPDELAMPLVDLLPIKARDHVWEPHAGGGAFIRALAKRGAIVIASDLTLPVSNAPWYNASYQGAVDFLHTTPGFRPGPMPDWIVGNPPFTGFERHVDHALTMAPRVAFLLRLAAMESAGRAAMWRRWPLRWVTVLAERPSFTGGGTDSAAYGFFLFDRDWTGSPTITPGWSWKGPR